MVPLWSDEYGGPPNDDERDLPWFILIVISLILSICGAVYFFGDWF